MNGIDDKIDIDMGAARQGDAVKETFRARVATRLLMPDATVPAFDRRWAST